MNPLRTAIAAALRKDPRRRRVAREITVYVPVPPSANALFSNVARGRAISRAYRSWRHEAGWILRMLDPPRVPGAYTITLDFSPTLAGDLDNRVKAVLDLLVTHGITDDDRHAAEIHVTRACQLQGVVRAIVRAASEEPS
jgi:Holliday junction resolvase RusA-like endonuclease